MAEKTKPQIKSLDDIAQSTARFMQSGELAKHNDYAAQLQNWYQYQQSIGGNVQELASMYDYSHNPEKLSLDIAAAAEIDKKKSLESVESGLESIVEKLDENMVVQLAVKNGLKDKKYSELVKAMQSDDQGSVIKSVRESYLDRNKGNEYLVAWAKNARPETWLTYSKFEISRLQQEFIGKNLYTETQVEKAGKTEKEAKYDPAKAKKFLFGSISGLKGKEKEQALLELGQVALSIFVEASKKKPEAK